MRECFVGGVAWPEEGVNTSIVGIVMIGPVLLSVPLIDYGARLRRCSSSTVGIIRWNMQFVASSNHHVFDTADEPRKYQMMYAFPAW